MFFFVPLLYFVVLYGEIILWPISYTVKMFAIKMFTVEMLTVKIWGMIFLHDCNKTYSIHICGRTVMV